jgi:hypothetical protein
MKKPRAVQEYISSYPLNVQSILQTIRQTIHEAVPGAQGKLAMEFQPLP